MEQFIVSARKYRPNSFESLIGQENIATTLKNSIIRGQLAHAYLFCGPRGVGKTTSARIFAKSINCLNPSPEMEPCGVCESCLSFSEGRSYCIHELDAASNNSVDDIRNLNEMVRIPPQIGKYSVYIIDEVHMLSASAFNAFLKTLEEPPAYAIFILATTEKHKILPTILSRCQTYDFNRISIPDIVKNLTDIAIKEGIKISEDALHIIAQKGDGAMRDALTLFDQTVAFCGKEITYEQVISNLNILDYEYYFRLIDHFLSNDYTSALLLFDEILSKGFNSLHFIGGLSSHLRDLIVCRKEASKSLLQLPNSLIERYKGQSERCSLPFLYEALNLTTTCEAGYRQSGNPRLHIEFSLMKLAFITNTPVVNRGEILAEGREVTTPKPTHTAATTPQSPTKPTIATNPTDSTNSYSQAPQAPQEPKASQGPQAPQTSQASQTSPSSAAERTPSPTSAVHPKTLSIKDMVKQAEMASQDDAKGQEIGIDHEFTYEDFTNGWKELIAEERSANRTLLATTLEKYTPKLLDDKKTFVFYVTNESQKRWVEEKRLIKMVSFIRGRLKNSTVDLRVEVAPDTEQSGERLPYTNREKGEYLLKENGKIGELFKTLDLEIK